MPAERIIQRALLSVSDKTGIVQFAQALCTFNIEILSTGGTAELLRQHHIPVIEVSEYTGFPEILSGRVKTLHAKIHGGLLGRRGLDDEVMAKHGIKPIDLLIVNLYPFSKTIVQTNCTLEEAIENIDIGGPTMLRAAAKNYKDVAAVIDSNDYEKILAEMRSNNGAITLTTRFTLAKKVFAHIAAYDTAIAHYLSEIDQPSRREIFPETFTIQVKKQIDLRYGENPQQQAAFYIEELPLEPGLATAKLHQGKALSFNNIADADAALECVKQFTNLHACVIVKHANPCGVALADDQITAYQRAYTTDPTSAFGGIIAFNRILQATTAAAIIENQFVEVIIAPEIAADALPVLNSKQNIRVLSTGQWQAPLPALDYKRVTGGLLIQERDLASFNFNQANIVTKRKPTAPEQKDLLFAWQVVKFVKSNAIVYAKNQMTIGIGAGQMSRVFSSIIAGMKAEDAGLEVSGSVMASDAFFPFRDSIDAANKIGITAIIQPGGSIRDEEVIQAANEANIAMVFTNIRHFRH